MYHSVLIHLSANGLLGCFHVLAILISAVMNTGVHMSLSVLVSSVCMPSNGIAGSCGSYISSFFKESPCCSPLWLHQFAFPPKVEEGSLFSTPSPAFIACTLLDSCHSDWREMIPHCSFDLHFSDKEWC